MIKDKVDINIISKYTNIFVIEVENIINSNKDN